MNHDIDQLMQNFDERHAKTDIPVSEQTDEKEIAVFLSQKELELIEKAMNQLGAANIYGTRRKVALAKKINKHIESFG